MLLRADPFLRLPVLCAAEPQTTSSAVEQLALISHYFFISVSCCVAEHLFTANYTCDQGFAVVYSSHDATKWRSYGSDAVQKNDCGCSAVRCLEHVMIMRLQDWLICQCLCRISFISSI